MSGGSGKRLWPLSNGTRSKQFLRLLTAPDGSHESMVHRVVRQLGQSLLDARLTVATSEAQRDSITAQLGATVDIVTEPQRRDTFPAIALAAQYLHKVKGVPGDQTVIVMPCDTFAGQDYYDAVGRMADAVDAGAAPMVVMGIKPQYASTKFGYLLPCADDPSRLQSFIEKPDSERARRMIESGAVWNGGVFAFKLQFMLDLTARYLQARDFEEFRSRYHMLPKISFDYEVAEKTPGLGVVYYDGSWKDLGTWAALSRELSESTLGNAMQSACTRTTVINELNLPIVCRGTDNLIVAASPDGILVADKDDTESIKEAVTAVETRPMYEERRWGTYKVVDNIEFDDGFCALTKQLTLNPGCSISYQRHSRRDEVWTFIDGEGVIVLDGVRRYVRRGDVITIPVGTMHALKAVTPLTFIEVQRGSHLVEDDIERFAFEW